MSGVMLWDPDDPRRIEWERRHPRLANALHRMNPPAAWGLALLAVAVILKIVLDQI